MRLNRTAILVVLAVLAALLGAVRTPLAHAAS